MRKYAELLVSHDVTPILHAIETSGVFGPEATCSIHSSKTYRPLPDHRLGTLIIVVQLHGAASCSNIIILILICYYNV